MSGLLERAAGFLLAPADDFPPPPRSAAAAPPPAPSAIVLGSPGDAVPVARLLSTELRLRTGASCVLLAEWRSGDELPLELAGVAPAAVRKLAERLSARGIETTARGRTVHLPLAPEPVPAVATLQRAVVAAGVPSVCALAGPRPAALDRLLDEQDLIVVAPPAGSSDALAELALAGLATVRAPVVVSRPVPRVGARLLAASSIATSRALGGAVTDAVRSLA